MRRLNLTILQELARLETTGERKAAIREILELLEDQQDEFFEKILEIYFDDDYIDIGMALTCCSSPVYMELSIAKVDDIEGKMMQVYFLNYIDVDRYLDYIIAKKYI